MEIQLAVVNKLGIITGAVNVTNNTVFDGAPRAVEFTLVDNLGVAHPNAILTIWMRDVTNAPFNAGNASIITQVYPTNRF